MIRSPEAAGAICIRLDYPLSLLHHAEICRGNLPVISHWLAGVEILAFVCLRIAFHWSFRSHHVWNHSISGDCHSHVIVPALPGTTLGVVMEAVTFSFKLASVWAV